MWLQDSPFNKRRDENQDVGVIGKSTHQPKPPPKYNQRVISPHFNKATNPSDSFPPSDPGPHLDNQVRFSPDK